MGEKVTMDVLVHKASVPMMAGESIRKFTETISEAAAEHVSAKLNLEKAEAWPMEIFSDKVVMGAYIPGATGGPSYYAFKYKRMETGKFDFGGMIEVERIAAYAPKAEMEVAKAMPGDKLRSGGAGRGLARGGGNGPMGTPVEEKKAVWTGAYVNDLPDAAFAAILPGGKKDKDGKTTPRSLRKFPHHSASVKSPTENATVDLLHLRNALARLDQAKIPDASKSKARSHLNAHAKELLPSSAAASSEKGCGGEKTRKRLGDPQEFGGWRQTSKSFWMGVL